MNLDDFLGEAAAIATYTVSDNVAFVTADWQEPDTSMITYYFYEEPTEDEKELVEYLVSEMVAQFPEINNDISSCKVLGNISEGDLKNIVYRHGQSTAPD